jgi:uncharacterized protein (TIGR02001 family)
MRLVRARPFLIVAVSMLMWSAPAAAAALSGEIGIVSDYRYRGLSLSNGNPALQASATFEHDSGLYATAWGSTLGHGTQAELDWTGGFSKELSKGFSLDFSSTYYSYPSHGSENYFEATALATLTRGRAEASLGFSFVPGQRATRDDDGRKHRNGYAFGKLAYELPKSPLTLSASAGYEHGWFDEVEHGGKWDWSLGADLKLKPVRIGVAYVGSNSDEDVGRRHAVVGSLFLSW